MYKSNNTVVLYFTNRLNQSMTIKSASCYLSAGQPNQSVNKMVAPHGFVNFTVDCQTLPIPISSVETSYGLLINYVLNGVTGNVIGILNVSNAG